MYSIELSGRSKKFLKKIPKKDAEIILKKLNQLKHNPFRYLKKLQGNKLWRLRISDYRAILDIIISGKRIIVLKIGQRKNIYK